MFYCSQFSDLEIHMNDHIEEVELGLAENILLACLWFDCGFENDNFDEMVSCCFGKSMVFQ